jgi:DeoR/GlpR family transcriptional regulator of sugar metabolism
MLSAERQQAISQLIARHGAGNVAELARQFQVSGSTIRRDLEQLEKKGLIQRTHGGAIALGALSAPSDQPPAPSAGSPPERIGRAAASKVQPGETVYLGPGRLTLATAKALALRARVTVVTNSLDIAHWLANHTRLTVILTGGTVGRPRNGLAGPLVSHALRSLRADRVILEAAGISPDQGVMHADLAQAELCQELINASGETIVLVPPERVGRLGGILIGPASDVDVIITGREASDATLWDLSQLGIAIITV